MSTLNLNKLEAALKDPTKVKDLEISFADMIIGISNTWELTDENLAALLVVSLSEIKEWTSEWGVVPLRTLDPKTVSVIVDFIEIYNLLASTLVLPKDQLWFFKESKIKELDNLSPFFYIVKNPTKHMSLTKEVLKNKF